MSIMQNVWSEGLKIFFNEKATLMKKINFLACIFAIYSITDFRSTTNSVKSALKENTKFYKLRGTFE